jgi:hypothetical protein
MNNASILRLGGVAAIGGGALRIANTFSMNLLSAHLLDCLYLVTDILLLLGLVGWYVSRADRLGVSGVIGFVVAIAGVVTIRSAAMFPGFGYVAGAMALLAGLVIMSIPGLLNRADARLPAWLWLGSFMSAIASIALAPLGVLSAILFGAGFICAGIHLLRS